jgi:hypothetical protein
VYDDASKRVAQLLVDRGGTKALGILNDEATLRSLQPASVDIVLDTPDSASFSNASFSNAQAETLSVLLDRGPAACLVLSTESPGQIDEGSKPYLPYDWTIEKEREASFVAFAAL